MFFAFFRLYLLELLCTQFGDSITIWLKQGCGTYLSLEYFTQGQICPSIIDYKTYDYKCLCKKYYFIQKMQSVQSKVSQNQIVLSLIFSRFLSIIQKNQPTICKVFNMTGINKSHTPLLLQCWDKYVPKTA